MTGRTVAGATHTHTAPTQAPRNKNAPVLSEHPSVRVLMNDVVDPFGSLPPGILGPPCVTGVEAKLRGPLAGDSPFARKTTASQGPRQRVSPVSSKYPSRPRAAGTPSPASPPLLFIFFFPIVRYKVSLTFSKEAVAYKRLRSL